MILNKLKRSEIIIIDDNEYYAQLIKANISKRGYKDVYIFNSGESGLEYINKKYSNIKCVILDHILTTNGLNGDGVLKKIKRYNNNINVIVISGQEDVKTATELMKFGAFDYIIKNDMTFFNLENTLMKLDRIILMDNNKMIIYSVMGILALSLLLLSFFIF